MEVFSSFISNSLKETYIFVHFLKNIKKYKYERYNGLYLKAIRIDFQSLFLTGKNVTYFLTILNIIWKTFENALISTVEVNLNKGHVVIQV